MECPWDGQSLPMGLRSRNGKECPMPNFSSCRSSSIPLRPAVIVARLDLSKPPERAAQDLVRRFSSGRWPLWRLLGIRREGRNLYVAVEWRRCRKPASYSVVEVSLRRIALRWWYTPSATAARRALEQLQITTSRRTSPVASPSIRRPGCREVH
jgi:hypothetical protein